MKTALSILASLLILGIGIGGFAIFGVKPEIPREEDAGSAEGVLVETATVRQWDQPLVIDVDGEAFSRRVVTVGAEVAGQIVEKSELCRSGTRVEAGEELFRIDDVDFRLEVERLTAEVLKAKEELKGVEIDIDNTRELILLANEDWELQKRRLSRVESAFNRKATTSTELDSALMQELVARNALKTLTNQQRRLNQQLKTQEAALKLISVQLKLAEADLIRCQVNAPVSGTIVDDIIEQGAYIKLGDPLVHISDSSVIEVRSSLHSDELKWIWQQLNDEGIEVDPDSRVRIPPLSCEVVYDFEGDQFVWDGVLSRFEGTGVDRDTRTLPCRVVVSEPTKSRLVDSQGGRHIVRPPSLLSGMYVTVRIPVRSSTPLLELPAAAVRPGGQLWVVRDGKLEIMTAVIARSREDYILLRGSETGLVDGDRVVISPLAAVQNGMAVREQESDK